MYVFAWIILGIFSISSALERGSICQTPNGEMATCIPVNLCQPIKRALTYLNPEAVLFAQLSQCGYDDYEDTYLVCCGYTDKPNTTTPVSRKPSTHFRKLSKEPTTTPVTSPSPHATIPRATFSTTVEETFTKANPLRPIVHQIEASTVKEAPTKANPLPPVLHNLLPDRSICGIHASDLKIVDGKQAQIREFPWLVSLKYSAYEQEGGLRCMGTLISKRYVLTAAECLEIPGFNLTGVRLGKWNHSTQYDCYNLKRNKLVCGHHIDISIEEEMKHPSYYNGGFDNNIALLRLHEEVEFDDFISPICLPPRNLDPAKPGSCMHTSLWNMGVRGTHWGVKLKGNICISPNQYCEQTDPHFTHTHPHSGCVDSENPNRICIDNSGSPLMNLYRLQNETEHHRWFQEGILYKGLGCHRTGSTVYTRITKHLDWIYSNIF